MPSYSDLKYATLDGLLECTKDDQPAPPSLESLQAETPLALCVGCRRLGVGPMLEFGKIGQPEVPKELADQFKGREATDPMLVHYKGVEYLVTSLHINPPKNFLEQENAYDRLANYHAEIGKLIPKDSRVSSLSLVDVALIEGLEGVHKIENDEH